MVVAKEFPRRISKSRLGGKVIRDKVQDIFQKLSKKSSPDFGLPPRELNVTKILFLVPHSHTHTHTHTAHPHTHNTHTQHTQHTQHTHTHCDQRSKITTHSRLRNWNTGQQQQKKTQTKRMARSGMPKKCPVFTLKVFRYLADPNSGFSMTCECFLWAGVKKKEFLQKQKKKGKKVDKAKFESFLLSIAIKKYPSTMDSVKKKGLHNNVSYFCFRQYFPPTLHKIRSLCGSNMFFM